MNYVEKVFDGFHYYFFDLNAATLSGAIDVIVIPAEDGSLRCTPFHVRFGKLQLLRANEKAVTVTVNDKVLDVRMKLGRAGEAFFVEELEGAPMEEEALTSPINSPPPQPALAGRQVVPEFALDGGIGKEFASTPERSLAKSPELSIVKSEIIASSPKTTSALSQSLLASGVAQSPPRSTSAGQLQNPSSGAASSTATSSGIPISTSSTFSSSSSTPVPASSSPLVIASTSSSMIAGSSGKISNNQLVNSSVAQQQFSSSVPIPTSLSSELPSHAPHQQSNADILSSPGTSPPPGRAVDPNNPSANVSASGAGGDWSWGWGTLPKRIDRSEMAVASSAAVSSTSASAVARGEVSPARTSGSASLSSSNPSSSTLLPPQPKGAGWRARLGSMLGMGNRNPANNSSKGPQDLSPDISSRSRGDSPKVPQRAHSDNQLGSSAPGSALKLNASPKTSSPSGSSSSMRRNSSRGALSKTMDATTSSTGDLPDYDDEEDDDDDSADVNTYFDASEPEMPPPEADREGAGGRLIYEHDNDSASVSSPTPLVANPTAASSRGSSSLVKSADDKDSLFFRGDFEESSEKLILSQSTFSPPPAARLIVDSPASGKQNNATLHLQGLVPKGVNADELEEIDPYKIELSLCGKLLDMATPEGVDVEKVFRDNQVSYDQFCSNPLMLNDDNLVCKIQGKIYPWSIAGPIFVSFLAFGKPLDENAIKAMETKRIKKTETSSGGGWRWLSWRRKPAQSTPSLVPPNGPTGSASGSNPSGVNVRREESAPVILGKSVMISTQSSAGTFVASTSVISAGTSTATPTTAPTLAVPEKRQDVYMRKSLRPSPAELAKMDLQPGANRVRFSVTTELRGKQEISATIFLWDRHTKIVISDIDGTITKSDVMGQLMPMIGRDWSHSGVTQLYSNIYSNNYKILYLTARAIGQSGQTKGYIKKLILPEGPVFMSPDRLLQSFNREVILRKPEEFKIAVLKDIQRLFPPGSKPFYAGFGNRQTDAISYRAVGVPLGKIFTINPRGDITIMNWTYKKTYVKLNDLVQEMFPSISTAKEGEDEDFNNFNYWKMPLPSIDSPTVPAANETTSNNGNKKEKDSKQQSSAVAQPKK